MRGITNGMVMQRNADNVCEIRLILTDSEVEYMGSVRYSGQNGTFYPLEPTELKPGLWELKGIPAGGPYTVYIGDQIFSDLYVGDVWLLAGQSNMEGVAEFTEEDRNYTPNPEIRELHMANYWMPAEPTLHKLWLAHDKIHTDVLRATPEGYANQIEKRCIGPGYFFAGHMYDYEGVPQGVIPCAHGGTQMLQWDPAERDLGGDKSLYSAMYRRFVDNGSHARGMFWYQGCSDAYYDAYRNFESRMLEFYRHIRQDFGKDLPIVQVQIARVYPSEADLGAEGTETWTGVREIQRKMSAAVPNLATAYTISYPMADPIHIARKSQKLLARNAAELMHALIHGQPAPEINIDTGGIQAVPNDYRDDLTDIIVPFTGVEGLVAEPYPLGFTLLDTFGKDWSSTIYKTVINGNQAVVGVALTPERVKEQGLSIAYGYGMNPGCNLTDTRGYSVPAFAPVYIRK